MAQPLHSDIVRRRKGGDAENGQETTGQETIRQEFTGQETTGVEERGFLYHPPSPAFARLPDI